MDQSVVMKGLLLLFLVHQTSTGVWYSFEADSDSDASDVDFYIHEIDDSASYSKSDYSGFTLEAKMEFHMLLINLNIWLCVLILAVVVFRISSNYSGATVVCFVIAVTSVCNGVLFTTFPTVLEEETAFFSNASGVSDTNVYFFQTYTDYGEQNDFGENGIDYSWGPEFTWYSTIFIIPLFTLYLLSCIAALPKTRVSKKAQGSSVTPNVPISVPGAQLFPNTTNDFAIEIVEPQGPIEEKAESGTDDSAYSRGTASGSKLQSTAEIKFSRPDIQTSFDPMLAIKGDNATYLMEGVITYSGCSEILFGTRNTDGRMVVVKKPYGYRNKAEKGKKGMVNTYAAARKQLENEHTFLSQMMKHNKSNFPELLDKFEITSSRRKEEYMVTKYFSPSLKKYVEFHGIKKGGLEYERGISLFVKIAEAVRIIHEKLGYVWADLKSENILMERNNPILIDFGTSTAPVTSKAKIKIDSGGWSASETIKGYPTFASDIYGLGKLLIYILTEIAPKEKQKPEVFKAQTSHELRKRKIDPRIGEIIIKCTHEDARDRYNNIDELLQDLQIGKIEETVCTNCAQAILGKVKFCRNCGKRVSRRKIIKKVKKSKELKCTACDMEIDSDSKFCKECGKVINVEGNDKKSKSSHQESPKGTKAKKSSEGK